MRAPSASPFRAANSVTAGEGRTDDVGRPDSASRRHVGRTGPIPRRPPGKGKAICCVMVSDRLRLHAFDAFADVAFPFLMRREAEHNLILGLSEQIRAGAHAEPFLAVIERGGEVEGVALRTPPHDLALSRLADAAVVDVVVEDARRRFGALPGVLAEKDDAARFARTWSEATGTTARLGVRQRIYEDVLDALARTVPATVARLREL